MNHADLNNNFIALTKGKNTHYKKITFRSAIFRDEGGCDKASNICYDVKNGDVISTLMKVIYDGGAWAENADGSIEFIPWPCANVLIE
jgi:hypothetical protein